jgi:REP element-mobilizing transposase RayT
MGTGHGSEPHLRQQKLFKTNWKHALSHGGQLRQVRAGRGVRPLSTKEPLHLVFKANRERLKHGTLRAPVTYTLIRRVVRRYAKRFFVKVEQISVQGDHIHLLIRAPRRSKFKDFFRVVAGQIAQIMEREALLNANVTDTPTRLRARRKPSSEDGGAARKGQEDVREAPQTLRLDEIAPKTGRIKAKGTELWKHRPFTRVIRGFKAYKIVRDYIQLNEFEARGKIPYRKSRLRGLSAGEWELLWC